MCLCDRSKDAHSRVRTNTTEGALAAALQGNRLAVQDLESLLQARNIRISTLHALLVGLGLGNASLLKAVIVFVHSVELLLNTGPVGSCLGGLFVKTLEFLRFILHVLFLSCLGDLVFLRGL